MKRALHMIHSSWQLRDYTDLASFDLIVCNAAMEPNVIHDKAKPSVVLAASFNAQMIPSTGAGNPFYSSLRSAMSPHYIVADGDAVRSSEYGDYFFQPTPEAYYAYADWISRNCPYSVLYLDDSGEFQDHKLRDLPIHPRDYASFRERYAAGRQVFLDKLQLRFNLIGNTGGWIHPLLSGVCIEGPAVDKLGKVMTLARFAVQWGMSRGMNGKCWNVDWHSRFNDLGWLAMSGEIRA